MKNLKNILILILAFMAQPIVAQVGINTSAPDASAALDIDSKTAGLLIPRLTMVQRDAITTPAEGLMIYQTDNTKGFYSYNGTAWVRVSGSTGEFTRTGTVVSNSTNIATDDFVFGSTQLNNETSTTNDDARMFFDKSKGAFRAGRATGTNWDDANVGTNSIGLGFSIASGNNSFAALGNAAANNTFAFLGTASAPYAIALNGFVTGANSTSIGQANNISGQNSGAFGPANTISGNDSFAFGQLNQISSNNNFVYGNGDIVNADYAIVLHGNDLSAAALYGSSSLSIHGWAEGSESTAIQGDAYGDRSVALGKTEAQSYGEVSLGVYNTKYSGANVNTFIATDRILSVGNGTGSNNADRSNALTILKNGNTGLGDDTPEATLDVEGTLQYVDGNQAAGKVLTSDASGNATWQVAPLTPVEFTRNGTVVSNTTNILTDDFVFGSSQLNFNQNDTGKMYFDKSKNAFRVGKVSGIEWDDSNVGVNSVVLGSGVALGTSSFAANGGVALGNGSVAFNGNATGVESFSLGQLNESLAAFSFTMGRSNVTRAVHEYSFAFGLNNITDASHALAFGESNKSIGDYSFSIGKSNDARGAYSFAGGLNSLAVGANSFAWHGNVSRDYGVALYGNAAGERSVSIGENTAFSFYENVVGSFNTSYTPASVDSWTATDRLFTIANGTSTTARSNALTILKNGNTGLGDDTPEATLDVEGTLQYVDGNQAAGRVLTSDASGNATWQVPSADNDWIISGTNMYSSVTGNVGIRTTAPGYPLSIRANASGDIIGLEDNTGVNQWHLKTTTGGNFSFTETAVADNRFVLAAGGNVGIGVGAPTRGKLEVNGSTNHNIGTFAFYAKNPDSTPLTGGATGSGQVSIYATDRVVASEFNAFSDVRIKNVKGLTNNQEDLETLASIEVTDYTKIDENDARDYKKVIAQQVATVFPQAVTTNTVEFVPNIYELSTAVDGKFAFAKAESLLKKGDNIKIILPESIVQVSIKEVTSTGFTIDKAINGQAFLYGTQVTDFHTVDYEAISMLNVSATQALLKKIQQQEAQLIQQAQLLSSQDSRLEAIENYLNLPAQKMTAGN